MIICGSPWLKVGSIWLCLDFVKTNKATTNTNLKSTSEWIQQFHQTQSKQHMKRMSLLWRLLLKAKLCMLGALGTRLIWYHIDHVASGCKMLTTMTVARCSISVVQFEASHSREIIVCFTISSPRYWTMVHFRGECLLHGVDTINVLLEIYCFI